MNYKKENFKNNRGITLLELLIYITILSGLMVVVTDAFISLSKARGQSEARSEVNSAIRFASDLIKQDIKNTTAVSSPLLGVPGDTLGLTVGGLPVLYNVSGGILRRTLDSVQDDATGGSVIVNNPVFTRFENFNPNIGVNGATTTSIQVDMTMRYNSESSDWIYSDTLRTTATMR